MSDPIISLDPGGKASVISYNVPDSTSYAGRHLIELALSLPEGKKMLFQPQWSDPQWSQTHGRQDLSNSNQGDLSRIVLFALEKGVFDKKYFPNISVATNHLTVLNPASSFANKLAPETPTTLASTGIASPVSLKLANLDPDAVAMRMLNGERLNIYRTLHGSYTYNFLPKPPPARPRLIIVEVYQFTSFLGNYGAGRTLSTFSLLPGEKTTISVKTYTKTETDSKSASSILDSFSHDASESFENSIQNEQSDKQNYAQNFEYHAEADAHASWGFGSADISGGVKGGSNSAREDFSKNVSNAADKHAATASSKRDININTSFESQQESGSETSVTREIQNINVGRTLNFVFRQMNQEFVSVLHLVDVRIGFFNGYAESRKEVAIHDMDKLFAEVLVDDPVIRASVKRQIVDELKTIFDYNDQVQAIIEEKLLPDSKTSYLRVKKNLQSEITTPDGAKFTVPGIPIKVDTRVMRTEGVIVEALLGQGIALDPYSSALQTEAVRTKQLANDSAAALTDREKLAQKVVNDGNDAEAKIYGEVFPPCPSRCACIIQPAVEPNNEPAKP